MANKNIFFKRREAFRECSVVKKAKQQVAMPYDRNQASSSGSKNPHRKQREETHDTKLSKSLSYILRHGAEKEKITMLPDGFVKLSDLLKHNNFKNYKVEDFERVVADNDKQRFTLKKDDNGQYWVRANQGHSLKTVEQLELEKITDASAFPIVIHGTYLRSWPIIEKEGLSKMNRNHIHFATGFPEEGGVISGMRGSCQVAIYINMKKAMEDGYEFFQSANNVILCAGKGEKGILPSTYFSKVVDLTTQKILYKDSSSEQ